MTPWTVAHQAPLFMEFSRPEYWSEYPFPSPGALPNPGIEPRSSTLQVDSLPSKAPGKLKNTGVLDFPTDLSDPGILKASLVAQMVKHLPAIQETWL